MTDIARRPEGESAYDAHPLGPKPTWLPSIAKAMRSRRDRRCDSCGEQIPKGSWYVRHALPPYSDIGNKGWWTLTACGWTTSECRRYWEIDAKDLSGEPHAIPVG